MSDTQQLIVKGDIAEGALFNLYTIVGGLWIWDFVIKCIENNPVEHLKGFQKISPYFFPK